MWEKQVCSSGGSGGGPATIADGADVTQGSIADAAVLGDNPGTVNAHLRGIDTILFDVWDDPNNAFRVVGPLTDAQLRASAVPVSGDWLTDAELRATPVPVSGNFATLGALSPGNSSTTPLGSSGTFTGTSVDVLNYTYIAINVFSDVASSSSGILLYWSSDNVSFSLTHAHAIPASTFRVIYTEPKARYLRVEYENGASAQAVFRLQTFLNSGAVPNGQLVDSSAPVSGTPVGENIHRPTGFVVYDAVPPGTGGSSRIGMAAMTNTRAQHVNLRDITGTVQGDNDNPLKVTGRGPTATTGTLTAPGQAVTVNSANFGSTTEVIIEISGTYGGTLTFQNNELGVGSWTPILAVNQATGALQSTLANGEIGQFVIRSGSQIRVFSTTLTSGTAAVSIYSSNAIVGSWHAVVGPLTDAQLRAAVVPVKEVKAATPAQSTVSVLTSSTSILAANAARLGATLYNESGAIAYVKLGATASLTSYSVQIAIGGYYEVPFGYTGAIDGITVAITAVLRVTELTV